MPQPSAGGAPANAGVIEGWVVRDVYRGTALIEGRMGMIEVDKGDTVPGLGSGSTPFASRTAAGS